jgi:NDP-sugar pyrophosphorylase family protein
MNFLPSRWLGLLVLAGGRATRMQSMLRGQPKALLELPHGHPLLLDIVTRARQLSMEVCVAVDRGSYSQVCAYLIEHNQVIDYSLDNGSGTAAAITTALERMSADFVTICNADTIVPLDILQLSNAIRPKRPVLQILAPYSIQNTGLIGIEPDRRGMSVVHWGEKSRCLPPPDLMPCSSSGAYIINRRLWLDSVNRESSSLEQEVMPSLVSIAAVEAFAVRTSLPIFDFGTVMHFQRLRMDRILFRRLLLASGADPLPTRDHSHNRVRVA